MSVATQVLSALMILIGLVVGALFVAAGAGRLFLERRA
jgi:hypothetical protein